MTPLTLFMVITGVVEAIIRMLPTDQQLKQLAWLQSWVVRRRKVIERHQDELEARSK